MAKISRQNFFIMCLNQYAPRHRNQILPAHAFTLSQKKFIAVRTADGSIVFHIILIIPNTDCFMPQVLIFQNKCFFTTGTKSSLFPSVIENVICILKHFFLNECLIIIWQFPEFVHISVNNIRFFFMFPHQSSIFDILLVLVEKDKCRSFFVLHGVVIPSTECTFNSFGIPVCQKFQLMVIPPVFTPSAVSIY